MCPVTGGYFVAKRLYTRLVYIQVSIVMMLMAMSATGMSYNVEDVFVIQ